MNDYADLQRLRQQDELPTVEALKMSPSVAKLAAALAKAQAKFEDVKKDKKGYNYLYSDLASVLQACRPHLAAEGIAIVQRPLPTDGHTARIETLLIHSSGEWISGELNMIPMKADPQGIGSVITYARRYSIQGMVGLASEDDDAASVSQQPKKMEPVKPKGKNGRKRGPGMSEKELVDWANAFASAQSMDELAVLSRSFQESPGYEQSSEEQRKHLLEEYAKTRKAIAGNP